MRKRRRSPAQSSTLCVRSRLPTCGSAQLPRCNDHRTRHHPDFVLHIPLRNPASFTARFIKSGVRLDSDHARTLFGWPRSLCAKAYTLIAEPAQAGREGAPANVTYRTDFFPGAAHHCRVDGSFAHRRLSIRGAEMLRITDKGFQYTPSFSTDLKKRFKKMIREQRAAAATAKTAEIPASSSVVPMARRSAPPRG